MNFQRRTPLTCGNPIIEERSQKAERQKHVTGLRQAKPVVDARKPAEEGSHRRHRRDHEHNKRQEAHARKEDTKMLEQISRTKSRSFSIPARIHISSLDSSLRRKEAQRIVAGNKKLLTRIQSAKSDYDFSRFDTEYIRHQKYALNSSFSLRKKCEKVLKIIPPHKTRYNPPQ